MVNTDEPDIYIHFVIEYVRHGTETFFDALLDVVV